MNKEEKINEYFNKLFSNRYQKYNLIFNNLEVLSKSQIFLEEKFNSANEMPEISKENLTKMDFLECIELAKQFYHDMGINYDVEKLVQNGTINMNIPKNSEKIVNYGCTSFKKNRIELNVNYNNRISDATVLVHELAHVRGIAPIFNKTYDFFTEAMAFTEQYIFVEYLNKMGYNKDFNILKSMNYRNLWKYNCSAYSILLLLDIYNTLGKVSLENCKFLYNNQVTKEDYQKSVDIVFGYLSKTLYRFFQPIYYSIGYMYAPYMVERYNENPAFFNQIKYLTANLNTIGIGEFFETIGLSNDEEEIENITSPYLDKYRKDCEEAYDKQRRLVK